MSFKILNIIENMFIKFFLFFLIINIIIKDNYQKKETNQLENYYVESICKLFYFTINYDCSLQLFTSTSFYDEIIEINKDINLLINIKKPKLENIFLLLCIIPFLKNNSTLSYKIKNKEIDNFLKKAFKNKRIKYKIIKFDYNDFKSFNEKINELLNYNWELIPVKFMLDNLNYIINNYYDEPNIKLFQSSLNMNFKSYIQGKKKELSYKDIESLLSKCSH